MATLGETMGGEGFRWIGLTPVTGGGVHSGFCSVVGGTGDFEGGGEERLPSESLAFCCGGGVVAFLVSFFQGPTL